MWSDGQDKITSGYSRSYLQCLFMGFNIYRKRKRNKKNKAKEISILKTGQRFNAYFLNYLFFCAS